MHTIRPWRRRVRAHPPSEDRVGVICGITRRALSWLLRRIAVGTLVVREGATQRVYGAGAPVATLAVRCARTWPLLLRGSRGLADAYAVGMWESPDLVALIRLAAANVRGLDRPRRLLAALTAPFDRPGAHRRSSTRVSRQRDARAHYDLGEELFTRMLDPTLSYSCAYFERDSMTLEQAQVAKLERICDKLALDAGDRVLEIGSGWGAFALHAAGSRGCDVTTTTISRAQHEYALQRVSEAGLNERVTVLLADYADLEGTYDKLVSVEMIEGIGWRQFGAFFAKCASLLEAQGAMLLQAITIEDRAYEAEKRRRSFINSHIFPGGCLPSLEAIIASVAERTDMQVVAVEDITAHYVETLRRWRERFQANADELRAHGYGERFRRLWNLYLAYCEAGFAERRIGDVQVLLAKPRWPARRSYREASSDTGSRPSARRASSMREITSSSTVTRA
jgi:cyclopropane-fatty-acyl-phospholipid synthase